MSPCGNGAEAPFAIKTIRYSVQVPTPVLRARKRPEVVSVTTILPTSVHPVPAATVTSSVVASMLMMWKSNAMSTLVAFGIPASSSATVGRVRLPAVPLKVNSPLAS